jgi:hypothetical protein
MFARTKLAILGVLTAGTPTALAAHEGHGLEFTLAGMLHWLLEPTHLLGTVLVLLASVVAGLTLRRRRSAPERVEP